MTLVEYINKFYGGVKAEFAAAQGVQDQQVTQWVNKHFIVDDHVLYSPRRELSVLNLVKRESETQRQDRRERMNQAAPIFGTSPNGAERELRITVKDNGTAELWIKPPQSDNGYRIEVTADALKKALNSGA